MKTRTQKMAVAAMLAAITCVATMIIKIPSPFKGYLNLGDCMVLFSGWILSPFYGFFAAGIGSALADIFSGYALYAPATFVIKGIMALVAGLICRKRCDFSFRIISAVVSEVVMVAGYLIFESALYGFALSVVNVPANAVQGVVGMIIGIILVKFFEKNKINMN